MTLRNLTLIGLGLAVGLMVPAINAAEVEAPDPPTVPQRDSAPRYVPLREVLPELSEQTGIEFQVPDSLQDELIPWTNNKDADDTPSMDWVRNFSHVDLVDEETGQRKIILLTSNSGTAPSALATQKTARVKRSVPDTRVNPPIPNRTKPTLSKRKLRKLIRHPSRYSLPLELYEDEEYRAFFSTLGVQTPKDLKNRKKVIKIRKAARRLIVQMLDD